MPNVFGVNFYWDFRPVSVSPVNKSLKIEQSLRTTKPQFKFDTMFAVAAHFANHRPVSTSAVEKLTTK
jgi:hypothetical protein